MPRGTIRRMDEPQYKYKEDALADAAVLNHRLGFEHIYEDGDVPGVTAQRDAAVRAARRLEATQQEIDKAMMWHGV